MNSPAYVLSKVVQRAQYNIGRVQKEAGLGKFTPLHLSIEVSNHCNVYNSS